jgi:peptidoglycan/LPS O-acetylase OafA/YrhL
MAEQPPKVLGRGQARLAAGAAIMLVSLALGWLVRSDISYLLRRIIIELPMVVALYLMVGGMMEMKDWKSWKQWAPWAVAAIYIALLCGAELALRLGMFGPATSVR